MPKMFSFKYAVLLLFLGEAIVPSLSATSEECSSLSSSTPNENPHEPSLIVLPVLRRRNMSVSEFRRDYSPSHVAIPLVFEDVADETFNASQWTRQALREECGHIPIIQGEEGGWRCRKPGSGVNEDCHSVRYKDTQLIGKTWAGLGVADVDELNLQTLADLIDRQDADAASNGGDGVKGLYLHDAPLSHYCPPAMKRIKVPKYFPRDYLNLEELPYRLKDGNKNVYWPSVFISVKGTGSPLHADSKMTRFWVQQLSGRKLWRIVSPTENWRLYSKLDEGEYYPTVFEADVINPDFKKHPSLDGAVVYETILTPGDVLFIPEGWAHQVVNLEDAVSTSMNFIDQHGLDNAIKNMKYQSAVHQDTYQVDQWTAFFMPLDDPPRINPEENIDFDEYFKSQHMQVIPVPSVVKKWVNTADTKVIDAYRDAKGQPALHVAAIYNFKSVVDYLVRVGRADVNVRDHENKTALDKVDLLGFKETGQMLKMYGGLNGYQLREREEKANKECVCAASEQLM